MRIRDLDLSREWKIPLVTRISGVCAYLSVDAAVVPGQPIPITVIFWGTNGIDLGTGCVLKVFLVDDQIFRLPDDGTFLPYLAKSTFPKFDIGVVHAMIAPPSPNSSVGQKLYAFGQRILRLEITTNGKDKGPYTDEDPLIVVPETLSQDWWKWQDNGHVQGSSSWKVPYTLSGFCENFSQYVTMDFEVELEEIDVTDINNPTGPKLYPGFTTGVGSAPQAGVPKESMQQDFLSVTQNWPWFIQGLWVYRLPVTLFKVFNYQAKLSLHDSYGNDYPPVLSQAKTMFVDVSADKINLLAAAGGAQSGAAALGIGAIAAPWLAVGAVAAGLAAAGFGDKAGDPPKPSSKFLSEVRPVPFMLPKTMYADTRLAELRAFLETLGDMLGRMQALSEIESRLLGARAKGSKRGIRLQIASYRRIMRQMVQKAHMLAQAGDAAAGSIREVFQSREVRDLLGRKTRIWSPKLARRLRKAHLPKVAIANARQLLANPQFRKMLAAPDGVTQLFRGISLPVVSAVMAMQSSSRTMPRGGKARRFGLRES